MPNSSCVTPLTAVGIAGLLTSVKVDYWSITWKPLASPTLGRGLRACPHRRLPATSRRRLKTPAEHLYRVPSLALSASDRPATAENGLRFETTRLFIGRALAVDRD